ncbi:MAG TPA: cobalamin-dependent protein [Gemmatimonadota bacterium]|nr:cobalamin-dependent protein [Gemmatimonadota bacterium]
MDAYAKRHPIRVAARRAGLSPDLLRVWELRYRAVEPGRSSGGQRRYSDADVERLSLLRKATEAGRRIGDVVGLEHAVLARLVEEDRASAAGDAVQRVSSDLTGELLAECLRAVTALDEARLGAALSRAAVVLTPGELVVGLVAPFMRRVGELWQSGDIDPANEHMATVLVRRVLTDVIAALPPDERRRRLLVATPAGERHEIGALLVATTAAAAGWAVTYLGTDLPAASIIRAALAVDAHAVALSAVSPADPRSASAEIVEVRERLRGVVEVFAGGEAALAERRRLEAAGVHVLEDVSPLAAALERVTSAAA